MFKVGKKGFTLVELLGVIVILAIVVGITIPIMSQSVVNVKQKSLLAIANTAQDYITDQWRFKKYHLQDNDAAFEREFLKYNKNDEGNVKVVVEVADLILDMGTSIESVNKVEINIKEEGVVCIIIQEIPASSDLYNDKYWEKQGNIAVPRDNNNNIYSKNCDISSDDNNEDVEKLPNPILVNGKTFYADGTEQELVTVFNEIDEVYYSTTKPLNENNFSVEGQKNIPRGKNVGTYIVYYYAEGNETYDAISGRVSAKILETVSIADGYIFLNSTSKTITRGDTTNVTFKVSSHHGGKLSISTCPNGISCSISGTTINLSNLNKLSTGTYYIMVSSGETAKNKLATVKYKIIVNCKKTCSSGYTLFGSYCCKNPSSGYNNFVLSGSTCKVTASSNLVSQIEDVPKFENGGYSCSYSADTDKACLWGACVDILLLSGKINCSQAAIAATCN